MPKYVTCRATFLTLCIMLSVRTYAIADAPKQVDIPAGELSGALLKLAKQYGADLVYRPEQVHGLKTRGAHGQLTTGQAITQLLQGTPLELRTDPSGAMLIAPPAAGSAQRTNLSGASNSARDASDDAKETGKKTSRDFRLAQVDQNADGPSAVENGDDHGSEKQGLAEIVVTGTHIRGIDNKTSPVLIIDRGQIDRSGYSSTQELLGSLPQNFANGASSADGSYGNNAAAGKNIDFGSGVDLRGLGPSATLVLLNGHRLAPSAEGSFVDVSQIPLAAIDRVEILTDGSSAIYGSDAVGGVINIILKNDYQGADTMLRYGDTANGGRNEELVAQTLGANWSGGNAVGTVQFQRQSALPATDRDFASALSYPNDLLPQTRSYGGTFDGRQALSENLEFYGDVLLSKREFSKGSSIDYPPVGYTYSGGDALSTSIAPGLRYEITPQWSLDMSGLYAYQKSTDFRNSNLQADVTDDFRFTEKSVDVVVNGRMAATPAGEIGIAVGTSYRAEDFNLSALILPAQLIPFRESRHVSAEFAEVHLPLVGQANRVPLIEALELSGAVRRDHYSDFGSTTNPHFGLRWAPSSDISLRASYGKSFRAPNVSEVLLESPTQQFLYNYQLTSPSGAGVDTILAANGSKPLGPERARTLNFGLEYKPLYIKGLSVAIDYYDIRFEDRIIVPPFPDNLLLQPQVYGSLIAPVSSEAAAQAIVNSFAAAGTTFTDYYGTGLGGIQYFYDDRQQNAALVRQSGFDFTAKFSREFGTHTLTSQANVSFIDKIDTQLSADTTFVNLVNTFGSPPRWRARLDLSWGGKAWSLSGALNAIGSYINTSVSGSPPIASWTTVDLNATFNADAYLQSSEWQGVSLSLIALNALNRDPPYAMSVPGFPPANYDPANANPLGRFVALALRKKW